MDTKDPSAYDHLSAEDVRGFVGENYASGAPIQVDFSAARLAKVTAELEQERATVKGLLAKLASITRQRDDLVKQRDGAFEAGFRAGMELQEETA